VAGVARNVAAFAAIYRFEFDAAHALLESAAPYHEMLGPFATVYARCFGGIAAGYQLDIPGALRQFREAYVIGARGGPHSHGARLAGALLGEVLYETGELAEAMRLLDDSYQLGSAGGGVDYLAARYVIGARIKAVHGDQGTAVERLAEGATAAEQLRLPRLAAAITNERIRLGIEIEPKVAARLRAPRTIPRDDGIAMITAELDENSGIRLLSASDSDDDREQACRRAAELLAGIDGERRPLAALTAQLLQIETFMATGRVDDANALLPGVAGRCRELGLSRLLVDAGLG
jgi:ATP/maltotriose-dependent transcriptional regulator MalT